MVTAFVLEKKKTCIWKGLGIFSCLATSNNLVDSSEYEKTMQKSWADVAEDETRNTL